MSVTTETNNASQKKLTLADIQRKLYSGASEADLAAAQTVLETIHQDIPADKIITNYSGWADGLLEGYNVFVTPVMERQSVAGEEKKKEIPIAVAITLVPSFDLLLNTEAGRNYCSAAALSSMATRLMNAIRTSNRGVALPLSVESFIESARSSEDLSVYKHYAPRALAYFRKAGLTSVTEKILRQCLQSSAFAKAQFSEAVNAAMEKALHNIIRFAAADGKSTAVLENWAATRDNMSAEQTADLSFDDIDSMLVEPAPTDAG